MTDKEKEEIQLELIDAIYKALATQDKTHWLVKCAVLGYMYNDGNCPFQSIEEIAKFFKLHEKTIYRLSKLYAADDK